MPAYLMANVGTDLLVYDGSFQNSLRSFFLWKSSQDYWFPAIRLLGGTIFLFSFFLYPYIFFGPNSPPRSCTENNSYWQNAWPVDVTYPSDGNYPTGKTTNNRRGFFSTNGGSCRLWNCEFFEINTLSQGVFDLWLNINDLAAASQFSLIVLFFVFVLLGSEPWIHRTQRFSSQTLGNISRKKLVGKWLY